MSALPELHERLAGKKEIARLVGIALRRFCGEIERPLVVAELDHQVGEVGVDDVVVRVSRVDERDRFQVELLRLADIAERLGGESEGVPRLVRVGVERRRAPQQLGRFGMPPLLVVDASEIVGHLGVGWRPLGRTLQRRFRIVVAAEEVLGLRLDLQRLHVVWRVGGDPLERGQRLGGMSRQQLRLSERERTRGGRAARLSARAKYSAD